MRISDWSSDVCSSDRAGLFHLLGNARADRGIFQPFDPFLEPARLHPGRHRGVEPGRAGGIGIHVGRDPQPRGARILALLHDRIEFAPIAPPRHLEVIAFGRSAEHTSELQSLMRISYAVLCLTKITTTD